jgi:hypothetical protein
MIGLIGRMRIVRSVGVHIAAAVGVAAEIVAGVAPEIVMPAEAREAQQKLKYEYRAACDGTDGEKEMHDILPNE